MMAFVHHRIKPIAVVLFVTAVTPGAAGSLWAQQRAGQRPSPAARAAKPTHNYWVYVGAESADLVHRIRFGPDGIEVEKTFPVGESPVEMEGPHGLQISRDGKYLHMTTGHGSPDGKYWRYVLGPDTLAGPGIFLGYFPASIDVTPDGLYAFAVNFNLHGEMVPSSVSVIYTPTHEEVARTETCVMPHGSRVNPQGTKQYSTCMMNDQLVEIDTRSFEVARRFSLAKGKEGPVAVMASAARPGADSASTSAGAHTAHAAAGEGASSASRRHAMPPATCSPTWAAPSADGSRIYVACNKADEIVEVDSESWRVSRRFPTGRGPYNLAATPDGKLLVATLKQGGGVQVFDLAAGRSVMNVKSSTTVTHGIALTPDSRYAFVSNESVGAAPGKVDVYDLRSLARVASVEVGQQAGGIAFWKMERAR
jgi:DNA-binding beta-propeller fold protein YncE